MDKTKLYQCYHCNVKFRAKFNLQEHVKSHFNIKSFVWVSIFLFTNNIPKEWTWTNSTPNRCKICGKSYTRRNHLTSHVLSHTGSPVVPCDKCEKKFYNKANLKRHKVQVHNDVTFLCDHCNKGFPSRSGVLRHKRVKLL